MHVIKCFNRDKGVIVACSLFKHIDLNFKRFALLSSRVSLAFYDLSQCLLADKTFCLSILIQANEIKNMTKEGKLYTTYSSGTSTKGPVETITKVCTIV